MNDTVTPEYLDLVEQALLTLGESAPDTIEQVLNLPKIKLFSGALKTAEEGGARVFRCTASSTIKDLHGDYMTEDCVRDMAMQAKRGPVGKGLTIFLNHSYKVPEDVAGKVADTQTLTRENGDDGMPIWDMDYVVRLATGSDRINQTWNLIHEDEITLGISIGAYILEYDFIDKEEGFWGGLIINKVLLVETSIVGIPANQRSWIQNGVIQIGKSLGFDQKQIRRVLDGKEAAPTMNNLLTLSTTAGTVSTGTTVTLSATPVEPTTDDPSVTAEAETPEVSDDAAPVTESTDESATEATTEEPSGETTEAAPATDLAELAPDIALSLNAGESPAVGLVLAALESAAATLKAERAEKATLQAKYDELTIARDQAVKDRDFAAEVIDLIAKSPLGRKTQFAGPVSTFKSRFSGVYDEAFLSLLDTETE